MNNAFCFGSFQDWNKFLDNFAELEFCVLGSEGEMEVPAASPKLSDKLSDIGSKLVGGYSTTEKTQQGGDEIV